MHFRRISLPQKELCGLPVELSKSQALNFQIISKHWKAFNYLIGEKGRTQSTNWEKYAITFKTNNQYFYMPALSVFDDPDFVKEDIVAGEYLVFQHKGSMKKLKDTYSEIYRKAIPTSDYSLDLQRQFLHFEKYDHRFNWNNPDSIIEIYIPIVNKD